MPSPGPLYRASIGSPLLVDPVFYGRISREEEARTLIERIVVPVRSGRAWPVMAGQVCRVIAIDGPQVVDFNVWNLEFFAEIDLLCAISTCPHGDMSAPTWGAEAVGAGPVCRPVAIETYHVRPELLAVWSPPAPTDYRGLHGF